VDVDAPTGPRGRGLPRGLVTLLGTAAAVLAVAGLHGIAEIVAPVFLALVLTVALHPLQGLLGRWGVAPWAATLLTLVAIYLILLGLVGAVALSVARLATLLPTYQDRTQELVDDLSRGLERLGIGTEQVRAALSDVDLAAVVSRLGGVLSGLLGFVSGLLLVLTVLFFLALDAAGFTARLATLGARHPEMVAALRSFASGTRRYLVVSTVFGLIVAVIDTGAVALLGIPLPLVWGLLSFVTNYIPNIGFVIGLIPPALLGLLEGGPRTMAAVIAVYCVINVTIQTIIQPKIVGDVVGLSATVSFLSLIFWTWVIGPLGAVLAIPLSILVRAVLLDADPSTRWLSSLISSGSPATPVPPSPSREDTGDAARL
jgi:predicted PurR-regulated permease PerM